MPSVKAMARHIPAWETVVIAGASHGTAQANPAFVDAVEAFLRRQRVAGR
jgi:hypothetical protein